MNDGWSAKTYPRMMADITGDGKADVVGFGIDGVWTATANGDGTFAGPNFVLANFGQKQSWKIENHVRLMADLTGDRKADIIGFGDAGVYTALSLGNGAFGQPRFVVPNFGYNQGWRIDQHPRFAADLTGDGRADLVAFGNDGVWTALSDGAGGFTNVHWALAEFGVKNGWGVQNPRFAVDLTGDGRADVIGFNNDGVWTAVGNGAGGFGPARVVVRNFGYNQAWRVEKHVRLLADVTGDGLPDIVGFGDAGVWVARNKGAGLFEDPQFVVGNFGYNQGWRPDTHPRFAADLTGDGKADLVGYGDAGVYTAQSVGGGAFTAPAFGLADFGAVSSPIKHVFMLMMENRSFDHLFGFSGITGTDAVSGQPTAINGLTGNETNPTHRGVLYQVKRGAEWHVDVDPAHEFSDVLRQLCGVKPDGSDLSYPHGGPYPPITMSGFADSYLKSISDDGTTPLADTEAPFKCFTPDQVPVLIELATNYALCDNWFSSMPGPTWPNRMFAHAASSGYLDDSPSVKDIFGWEIGPTVNIGPWQFGPGTGFTFGHGTIYDSITRAGGQSRVYAGDSTPMSAALAAVKAISVRDLGQLGHDLAQPDFAAVRYVHIEPNYDSLGNFRAGNSQHPISDIRDGNELIRSVYETIRNSPVWNESVLIITWDEHGGFYDHVKPPAAPPPRDPQPSANRDDDIDHHGFAFDQYGPRVPAIIISPWIPKGIIDHRLYDHASIPAAIGRLFGLPPLTERDAAAHSPLTLCTLSQPRTDVPGTLSAPQVGPPKAGGGGSGPHDGPGDPHLHPFAVAAPVPTGMSAFLTAAFALDVEISSQQEATARAQAIGTLGDAQAYLADVQKRLAAYRARMLSPPPPPPPPPASPPPPPPPPPRPLPPPPPRPIGGGGRPPIREP
jgi:phospholipase C